MTAFRTTRLASPYLGVRPIMAEAMAVGGLVGVARTGDLDLYAADLVVDGNGATIAASFDPTGSVIVGA